MRFRGDSDDPRRRRGPQPIEQQIGQQERGEMIDRKGQLEPVGRNPRSGREQPGVVDEDTDPVMGREDFVREAAHLGECREIGELHLDRRARRLMAWSI